MATEFSFNGKMVEFEDDIKKKVGFMTYVKCPICEDISFHNGKDFSYCINEHKGGGEITQPISEGINKHGKLWRETPIGMKSKKHEKN